MSADTTSSYFVHGWFRVQPGRRQKVQYFVMKSFPYTFLAVWAKERNRILTANQASVCVSRSHPFMGSFLQGREHEFELSSPSGQLRDGDTCESAGGELLSGFERFRIRATAEFVWDRCG